MNKEKKVSEKRRQGTKRERERTETKSKRK